jgi:L-serine dehydratase
LLSNAKGVRVRLYGALSATGKGRGTDRAAIAGLMAYEPSTCTPTLLNDLDKYPKEKKFLALGNKNLNICLNNIEYCLVAHNFPHNNTLIIDLLSQEFDNKGKHLFN